MPNLKYRKNTFVGIHPEPRPAILHAAVVDLKFWTWDNISSPFWRWYWNEQPGAYVERDGKRWELHPDFIVLVPPGIELSCHTPRRLNHFFIDFTLPKTGFLPPREPMVKRVDPVEKKWINAFVQGISAKEQAESWQLSNLAQLLVEHSIPCIKTQSSKIPESDPRIDRAIHLIHLQPMNKYPVSELAKNVGMSTCGFIRLFSRFVGQSAKQYQLSHWVEMSCHFLLNPSISIDDIASRCGFYDRFHYSKSFRALMKCSPGAFRKNYRVKES
ncbi:MAG: helix-turn-helix domain-containing protein [Terrimicrobiaceae bacterium]